MNFFSSFSVELQCRAVNYKLARNWILCFPRLYCLCCGSLLLLQRFVAFKNSSINESKWNVCVYTFFVVYFEWKRDWLCWLTWRSRSIVPSQPLNTRIHSNIFSQSQNSHQNQFTANTHRSSPKIKMLVRHSTHTTISNCAPDVETAFITKC